VGIEYARDGRPGYDVTDRHTSDFWAQGINFGGELRW
jgi:hypothetical protein